MKKILFVYFLCSMSISSLAFAHELRPAYLELSEDQPGEFSVLWKTPMRGEMRLALSPEFSGKVENISPMMMRRTGDAAVQTWRLRAITPLQGQSIRIKGLEGTMTDALVRVEYLDGSSWVKRLTPAENEVIVPDRSNGWRVAGEYARLGIEHIFQGIDHLFFILMLLIITRGGWKLVKTVTAFTVSHSVTLTLAALGVIHMPQKPVEAVIALSIVFVASEIIRQSYGRDTVTARAPWVVAFLFGLLHGLGFAGALGEIGLPAGHIPAALLSFSIGVEIGHLLFVGAVVSVIGVLRRLPLPVPSWARLAPSYAIGSIAAFWVFERVSIFY